MKKNIIFFSIVIPFLFLSTILQAQFGVADTLILHTNSIGVFKIADINADGYPDIITRNIDCYLGLGNFKFEEPFRIGENTVDIELLDFNNDGLLDVFSEDDDGLYWYLNTGNGIFEEPIFIDNIINDDNFGSGISDNVDTDLADIDNDGDQDIIVATGEGLGWFEHLDGNGTIGAWTSLISFGTCEELEVLDWDEDGDMDILTNHDNDQKFFSNNGDGTFAAPIVLFSIVGFNNYDFRIKDINNDDKLDILRSSNGWTTCYVYLNNGDNTFDSNNPEYLSISDDDVHLVFQDINYDGLLDVLYRDEGKLKVAYQQEPNVEGEVFGDISNDAIILLEGLKVVSSWHFEDINGDGISELVYLDVHGNLKSISLISDSPQKHDHGFSSTDHYHPHYVDMDNDNDLDLVAIEGTNLVWSENDGTGDFSSTEMLYSNAANYESCIAAQFNEAFITPFDKDGDGDVDFIIKCAGSVRLIYNDNGNYSLLNLFQNTNAVFRRGLILGDFNNDGYQDILSYDDDDNDIRLYSFNGATGSFSYTYSTIYTNTVSNLNGLYINDFDNDGDKDLIIQRKNDNDGVGGNVHFTGIPVLIINENGSFTQEKVLVNETVKLNNLKIADMNNDGLDDIILRHYNGLSTLQWLENTLDDNAFIESHFISSKKYSSINVADLDADGDMDIMADNDWFDLENGLPTSGAQSLCPQGVSNKIHRDVADIDNDGQLDVLMDYTWIKPSIDQDGNIIDTHPFLVNGNGIDYTSFINPTKDMIFYTNLDSDPYLEILVKKANTVDWIDNLIDPNTGENILVYKGAILSAYDEETIYGMAVGDINADGKEEIVLIGNTYLVYHQLVKDGIYSEPIVIVDNNYTWHGRNVWLGDFNGSGYPDIITTSSDTWISMKILINNNGAFSVASYYNVPNNSEDDANVKIMDYDGNNIDDLLHFHTNGGVHVYEGENLSISSSLMDETNTFNIRNLIIKDLEGDNDDDLLILATSYNSSFTESIHLGINMGGGQFDYMEILDDENNKDAVTLIDVDNNGLEDILYHYLSDPQPYVILQESLYTFSDPQPFQAETPVDFSNLRDFHPFDFDNDGDEDLIYINDEDIVFRENLANNPTITGSFYFDENQNGTFDDSEIKFPNYIATLTPQALYTSTGANGDFLFKIGVQESTLSYLLNQEHWSLSSDSASYTIYSDTITADHRFDFGFYPNIDTLSVSPFATSATTRCGFTVPFWVNYTNTGTRTIDGEYHFILDHLSTVDLSSIMPVPDMIIEDTIIWNIENLQPTLSSQFYMEITMPNEEHVDTYRNFYAVVEAYDEVGDSLYINEFNYSTLLSCAIDPNDKSVTPNRLEEYDVNYTLFEEELTYVIRFQNLGNDTAFNIVVVDQLDAKLDWESFRPLASSHPYDLEFNAASGLLTFNFNDILLPDATTNEIGSNGYVAFAIKPKEGLEEEDIIANEAYIYFDFNAPIITNEIESVMVSELPFTSSIVIHPANNSQIKISPNPVSKRQGTISIDTNLDDYDIEIYDINGVLVLQKGGLSKLSYISLDKVSTGIFFIHIIDKNKQKQVRKLIHIN